MKLRETIIETMQTYEPRPDYFVDAGITIEDVESEILNIFVGKTDIDVGGILTIIRDLSDCSNHWEKFDRPSEMLIDGKLYKLNFHNGHISYHWSVDVVDPMTNEVRFTSNLSSIHIIDNDNFFEEIYFNFSRRCYVEAVRSSLVPVQ